MTHRLLASLAAVAVIAAPRIGAQTPTSPARSAVTVAAAARAIQPGEIVVLTITAPAATKAVDVRALDHDWAPYRVDATTWRVLVGIDLEAAPKSYPATATAIGENGPPSRATYSLVVKPKTFATRTLTVDEAYVNPPASVLPRIREEAARLTAIWSHVTSERLWSQPWAAPVPEPPNSAFGKRSVTNGQPGSPHSGADFPSPPGEAVKAPNAGRVVLAEELYYSGNTVILDHGLGMFSLFAHLSAIGVKAGDQITPGQVLGKVGATGRVTGPHLHWSVRLGGARVDPMCLLSLFGSSAARGKL